MEAPLGPGTCGSEGGRGIGVCCVRELRLKTRLCEGLMMRDGVRVCDLQNWCSCSWHWLCKGAWMHKARGRTS